MKYIKDNDLHQIIKPKLHAVIGHSIKIKYYGNIVFQIKIKQI